ncbi:alpha-1,2-fucosyltransferase [Sulfurovum sp.]|uniref:alpha-1,2-fucosyltransferase n=1 Tax=Sulfurovum sp. TaxID=1969726 RepID=UPI003569F03D
MILFLSDGRLGNQLFQFAFLNTIAKKDEKIIMMNIEQFSDIFDIQNPNFHHLRLGKYTLLFVKKILKPFFLILFVKFKIFSYIKQDRDKHFSLSTYTKIKGLLPITLVETNFFQAEKFFQLSKIDFNIKQKYVEDAKKFLDQVPLNYDKVFVHVRRGDYIFESYLGKTGIDLPKSYFDAAITIMTKNLKNPFFIFLSDDPAFVECCFKELENKLIPSNTMATDLAIMTLCNYGIVSNSSFSWWGAYLMKNKKKVIFPKYWYGWKSKVESHIDIQPHFADVIEV